jgi:cytochrome c551/c552
MTTDTHSRLPLTVCAIGALAILFSAACGTSAPERAPGNAAAPASTTAATAAGGLTPFQLEHGIGPVTEPVALDGIDKAMHKCAACHKMAERYVGPPLGDVTKRRSPAFVMNMVLNPQGMVEKHPASRKLLGEFYTQMPNLSLSQAEARELLEYLRTQAPSH